jgi:hypothetical protein
MPINLASTLHNTLSKRLYKTGNQEEDLEFDQEKFPFASSLEEITEESITIENRDGQKSS